MSQLGQDIKEQMRALIRTFYMNQKLRIQHGNRIWRHFSAQLGQEDGKSINELSAEAKKFLEEMHEEFKLMGDAASFAVLNLSRWNKNLAKHSGVISTPFEYAMAESYVRLKETEDRLAGEIAMLVAAHPLWGAFLEGVRGVGPILAAVLISEFDPYKARHASAFVKYAGIDVVERTLDDGTIVHEGRSKRQEHLILRDYLDKNGEKKQRWSVTYNPFLKAKLLGVLCGSFLRSGSPYAQIYRDYRFRLENRPDVGIAAEARGVKGASKLRRHRMALRYMLKCFLYDLWSNWRTLEGLPVTPPYAEAKLGLVHGEDSVAFYLSQLRPDAHDDGDLGEDGLEEDVEGDGLDQAM